MKDLNALRSPVSFLQDRLQHIHHRDVLEAEETWWKSEGVAISDAIDRAETPWLRHVPIDLKHLDETCPARDMGRKLVRASFRSDLTLHMLSSLRGQLATSR